MDVTVSIDADLDCLRNGVQTGTQTFNSLPNRNAIYQETPAQYTTRRNNNIQQNRGLHESYDFYNDCYMRSRNLGEPVSILPFVQSAVIPLCLVICLLIHGG